MPITLVPQVSFLFVEFVLTVLALALAWFHPLWADAWWHRAQSKFTAIARRPLLPVLICGMAPVVLRLVLLPWFPVPEPAIQEEASYLLNADTFAHGRLANPPHPMATHFETFQVLQKPTYSSIRPPAHSAFMAVGERFFGGPWAGICLSTGLFCAALCWMLRQWLSDSWAFAGGLLAVLRIGIFSFWMNTYMGGQVAALGGVLVLGALPPLRKNVSVRYAAILITGTALLINSRAFEALFLLVPVFIWLLVWLVSDSQQWQVKITRFFVPAALLLVLVVAWMCYYNHAITGSYLQAPYTAHRLRYAVAEPFWWKALHPIPVYRHRVLQQFYAEWELNTFQHLHTASGYFGTMLFRLYDFWRFYIRPAFTIPLLFLPLVLRNRRLWLLLAILGLTVIGQGAEIWFSSYYAAPIVGAFYVVLLECLRRLAAFEWKGRKCGLSLVRSTFAITLAMFFLVAGCHVFARIQSNSAAWASGETYALHGRALLQRHMEALPGKQLVIVRYLPQHDFHAEWVFNDADIDNEKVVWAHDMGKENEELLNYYPDREVWLAEPDHPGVSLKRLR